jgi:hypothetical protein
MISFVAGGYIEVFRNSQFISRHRIEREAVESCARHGAGTYELRYPTVKVVVEGKAGVINGSGTLWQSP